VLVWLKPGYKDFLRDDGTMIVRITKALYGCVESARLWFNDLKGTLIADGYVQNPYDPCVFNKTLPTGEQITVGVYVGDVSPPASVIPHCSPSRTSSRRSTRK
jgi:hypothetical protein